MFTALETEENDVFTCNFCGDIFVSKDSIRKHLVEVHEEEDFEDSGSATNVPGEGVNNPEKENNEIKGGEQPWWLEDIFYVCDVCYEIFSNGPGLRNHQRVKHKQAATTGEVTEAKDEKDERKLTVNTSLLNTNLDTKTKPLKSKMTKRSNSISKKEAIQGRNDEEIKQDVVGQERSSGSCFKCGLPCRSLAHRKNHILSHYYSAFTSLLPTSSPYVCPQCSQISRDRITLIRHFAFSHKKMYQFTGVTEDLLLLK